MGASKRVVMVEHGALELNILPEETQVLHLLDFLLVAGVVLGERRDVIHIPDVAALLHILVTVDLGLLVGPVGQRTRVSPHGHLSRNMDKLEVCRHRLEVSTLALAINLDLE